MNKLSQKAATYAHLQHWQGRYRIKRVILQHSLPENYNKAWGKSRTGLWGASDSFYCLFMLEVS